MGIAILHLLLVAYAMSFACSSLVGGMHFGVSDLIIIIAYLYAYCLKLYSTVRT